MRCQAIAARTAPEQRGIFYVYEMRQPIIMPTRKWRAPLG